VWLKIRSFVVCSFWEFLTDSDNLVSRSLDSCRIFGYEDRCYLGHAFLIVKIVVPDQRRLITIVVQNKTLDFSLFLTKSASCSRQLSPPSARDSIFKSKNIKYLKITTETAQTFRNYTKLTSSLTTTSLHSYSE
jgi:hypothetical protein